MTASVPQGINRRSLRTPDGRCKNGRLVKTIYSIVAYAD